MSQLYSVTTVQCHNCTVSQLYSITTVQCTTVQCHNCTVSQLYSITTVQCHNCTVSHCTVSQQFILPLVNTNKRMASTFYCLLSFSGRYVPLQCKLLRQPKLCHGRRTTLRREMFSTIASFSGIHRTRNAVVSRFAHRILNHSSLMFAASYYYFYGYFIVV